MLRLPTTDADLAAFIEDLPSEEELRAELGSVLPERRCAVCQTLLELNSRRDRVTCSGACRTALWYRRRKARASHAFRQTGRS